MAARRVTIRDLAVGVGVNSHTVGRVLNAWETPWPQLRRRVAEYLGVSEDECWRTDA
jgi:lambda repressor-like predicted transcriptional regulator